MENTQWIVNLAIFNIACSLSFIFQNERIRRKKRHDPILLMAALLNPEAMARRHAYWYGEEPEAKHNTSVNPGTGKKALNNSSSQAKFAVFHPAQNAKRSGDYVDD